MNLNKNMATLSLAASVCILSSLAGSSVLAVELFVSTRGSDQADGTETSPLASLAAAQAKTRSLAGREAVTIHVADGVYYLPETLLFDANDSGSEAFPITYQAVNEGQAILSGGTRLKLEWTPHQEGIYQASVPPGIKIDQLFVDGRAQRMARYPNYDPSAKTVAYQGFAADAFSTDRARRWSDPTGGYIHAMHRARWGGYHYRITGKADDGSVTYEGGWQNNRQMGMHNEFRMVENVLEELDAAGEWFHDSENMTLYYLPMAEIDLAKATIEVVRLRHLIEMRGSSKAPVSHLTLKGFQFRHAARTFMETREPMLRSDWAIYRGGALLLTGTEDIQILDSEFDQVGGNAIFASNYNRRILIEGCHIHDTGASGICFVGDPKAVRNPLFEYRQKNDLSKIDRTPGPQTDDYPADCTVADCLIAGIGRVERQPAGVQIEMARRIRVRDCSIYDCARAGINIGDGAWGGHLIEKCDVFDTVQETHDHGSFNSWGRDRFWSSDRKQSQTAVDEDPSLPFLDAVETTVIRNSRFRCDHGWDIDLDDGSSNYDIYNNLMLSGGLKLREGFRRRAWNNITVNNGLHPHVWYDNSGDEVYSNVFMAAPKPARMPTHQAKGKRVDENLYFSANPMMKDRFVQFGWDVNSIVADPKFMNPSVGDFRVSKDSPASLIGFENFPMDQFGVKKPSLKAIAKTPILPTVDVKRELDRPRHDSPQPPTEIPLYWLGCRIKSLAGDEFSAFGVSQDDGGVALSEVTPNSDAAKAGLRNGDLIQSLNTMSTPTTAELLKVYCTAGDSDLLLTVVRDQQPIEMKVSTGLSVQIETVSESLGFRKLILPKMGSGTMASNQLPKNAPLDDLVDGQIDDDYGPVFSNSVFSGVYQMDLGSSKSISQITTWSTNKNGSRGHQKFTLYGSNSATNPGWSLSADSGVIPLATIDSTSQKSGKFMATSLRSNKTLGTFRWIYWQVSPVSARNENTAFQEFDVR